MGQRILIITDYFYPHWTGISKSIFNLAQALADQLPVKALTVKHQPDLPAQETVSGVEIFRAKPAAVVSRTKLSVSLPILAVSHVKNSDVVVVNSPCTYIFPVSILAKLMGKKLIIFHQGDLILNRGLFNCLLEWMFDGFTWIGCWLADKVGTYTRDYAQHSRILRFFLTKFEPVVLPHPDFKSDPANSAGQLTKTGRTITDLKQRDKFVFGFAGRFVREKGFDVLFQAIKLLPEQANLHFVFAGETDVSYEQTFERNLPSLDQIKSQVSFLGLLSGPELHDFYQEIDCFVLSSRSECFGLVQPEAMAQHTPVLASDVPGARQVVLQTDYGLLFANEDEQDLADKLLLMSELLPKLETQYSQVEDYFDYQRRTEQAKRFLLE